MIQNCNRHRSQMSVVRRAAPSSGRGYFFAGIRGETKDQKLQLSEVEDMFYTRLLEARKFSKNISFKRRRNPGRNPIKTL